MWFLFLAIGGLLAVANRTPAHKTIFDVSGGAALPWGPPPGSTLAASMNGALRGTPFPVDIYNWQKNGVLYVLAVACKDPSSFVAYRTAGGPSRKILMAEGPGILSQQIRKAAGAKS